MLRQFHTTRPLPEHFLRYAVPMKSGDAVECYVADPMSHATDVALLIRQYENAMTSAAPDVVVKRENTLRFLRLAAAKSAEVRQRELDVWARIE